jgi:hypothetical protein
LSLRRTGPGSFAVPREWTDWAPPGTQAARIGSQQPLLIDALGLLLLTELIISLKRKTMGLDR